MPTSRVNNTAHISNTSPWLEVALGELGIEEYPGDEHNPRILHYLDATPVGKWSPYDETAWCGAFAAYCVSPFAEVPAGAHRARSWIRWGVACEPELGRVCVIKRRRKGSDKRTGSRGGYHVGFYLNHSRGGVVLLSGNASDRVGIDTYSKRNYEVSAFRTAA
jgi:uncharacterized protein (TIGR02594 family)